MIPRLFSLLLVLFICEELSAQVFFRNSTGAVFMTPGHKVIMGSKSTTSVFACGTSTVSYDGEEYQTIEFVNGQGQKQCWLAENLRYNAGGAWSDGKDYKDPKSSNSYPKEDNYGYLYDWEKAGGKIGQTDPAVRIQGICPSGWAIPSGLDWYNALGVGGGSITDSDKGWSQLFLPMSGACSDIGNTPFNQGKEGYYWSSLYYDSDEVYIAYLSAGVANYTTQAFAKLFSVRCIKEDAPIPSITGVKIGEEYDGGIVFYVDGTGHGLMAALVDQDTKAIWGDGGVDIQTDINFGTGQTNTSAMVAMYGEKGYAGDICDLLDLDGHDDWYLPSLEELQLMYKNLKTSHIGNFSDVNYWSSSQLDSENAWSVNFKDGSSDSGIGKTEGLYIRAIRSF